MKTWEMMTVLGVAAVGWAMNASAEQPSNQGAEKRIGNLPVRAEELSKQATPVPSPLILVSAGKEKPEEREVWRNSEFVFVGDLLKQDGGEYFPVSYLLTFKVAQVVRGDLTVDQEIGFGQFCGEMGEDKFDYPPVGTRCLVAGKTGAYGMKYELLGIVKADAANVAAALAETLLPLGWTRKDGKPVSPWAALGKAAWPTGAGQMGAKLVCSVTERPALQCGEGVKFTATPLPPKKSIRWTNPDGDGDYQLTVTNTTDKPVTVPALLSDGKEILWQNSIVIIFFGHAYPVPGYRTDVTKLELLQLNPGQSVSGVINPLGLSGDFRWPLGGERVGFQFCLGEKSVTHHFHYSGLHHGPISAAMRTAGTFVLPPPAIKPQDKRPQPAPEQTTLTVERADSEETAAEDGPAANAVDNDLDTYWHTRWSDDNPAHPHEIVLKLGKPGKIKGVTYLPRRFVPNGTIKDYEIYVSSDGKEFGRPVAKGTFNEGGEEKTVVFDPKECGYIKLKALSAVDGNPWTSAAEIRIIPADGKPVEKSAAPADGTPVEKPAASANGDFAAGLYTALAKENPGKNLFFSPYSMSTALAMTAEGARKETAEEMGKVLGFPQDARHIGDDAQLLPWNTALIHTGMSVLNERFKPKPVAPEAQARLELLRKELAASEEQTKKFYAALQYKEGNDQRRKSWDLKAELSKLSEQTNPYELRVANALYGEKTYPFQQSYLDTIHKFYGTGTVVPVDFINDFETVRGRINAGVEKHTNQRIKDLIAKGGLDELTRLVLVNAIYFKGDWAIPFDARNTKDEDFLAGNGKVSVPMMRQDGMLGIRYGAFNADGGFFQTPQRVSARTAPDPMTLYPGSDGFVLAELPYKGKELSMVVLVPQDADGLGALEAKLTSANLQTWLGKLEGREVNVQMPKFKLETDYQKMGDTLKAMGMVRAFTDPTFPNGAQFDGMCASSDPMLKLYITKVCHKAFVEVNEQGTEATAATAGVMGVPMSEPRDVPFTPTFRADKPFVFAIRDVKTGTILFLGRVMDPTK